MAAIPAGIAQALYGGLIAGLFLLLGKGADWLVKRGAERHTLTLDEQRAEDDRLEGIADRFRELAVVERERANQIAGERDMTVQGLEARINALSAELDRLKAVVADKDALISEQANKISRLERRVRQLEEHGAATHERGEGP